MKTKKLSYFVLASLMMVALLNPSCKKAADPAYVAPPAATVTGVQITYNATLGNIVTDNLGRSLYFFSKDAAATGSACTATGNCTVTWLPFYQATPTVGTGLVSTDLGVTTRPDGTKQTTYKGWPLYYNVNDLATGDVKGDGVGTFWAVAKASYNVMFANAQLVGGDGVNYTSNGIAGTGVSQYLVDAYGRTLYFSTNDTFNSNHFTTADPTHNAIWPTVPSTGIDDIPTVFNKTEFGVIATVTGGQQLTYRGHPLYYFGADNATKGNTKGVSAPTPGAAIFQVANTATVALH